MYAYIIIIVLFKVHFTLEADTDFCKKKYDCESPKKPVKHTICQLKHECGQGPNCKKFESKYLSEKEKQSLLDKHNELRNMQALGKGPKSKEKKAFPTAANMNELVWDKDLEFQAQCWANQCPEGHDTCRKMSDGTTMAGQNLAWSSENEILTMTVRFYNECQLATIPVIDRYVPSAEKIGHFSQLVWAETSKLGCARSRYYFKEARSVTYFLTCNYAIAGNWLDAAIYTKGKPCSKCSKGSKCHAKYKGLCTTKASKSKMPSICKYASNPTKCKPILPDGKKVQDKGDKKEKPTKAPKDKKGGGTKKPIDTKKETGSGPDDTLTTSVSDSSSSKGNTDQNGPCIIERKVIIVNSSIGYGKKFTNNLLIMVYLLYHFSRIRM